MRVLSVKRIILPIPVPVYDLSVPGTENFKLDNGPFVHNSKDIADALAGTVYGLTMRKEIWLSMGENPRGSPSVAKELEGVVDDTEQTRSRPIYRRTR